MTPRFWVEISALDHGHGGPGWELGHCLWSPAADRLGRDRYAIMREPRAGDHVFHIIRDAGHRALTGLSTIAAEAEVVAFAPPHPGEWAGFDRYYRIPLINHVRFSLLPTIRDIEALHADAIRADIFPVRPAHHPYSPYGRGVRITQGLYLGLLTNRMVEIFSAHGAMRIDGTAVRASPMDATLFVEGEQVRRELTFFARNPALKRAALERWGLSCDVCGFDFAAAYGSLGEGYIEVHHLEPLATKALLVGTSAWSTSVDDVRPLCANCHRMAHRKRPPISLDDLRRMLQRMH